MTLITILLLVFILAFALVICLGITAAHGDKQLMDAYLRMRKEREKL
jgi:hypothetical protein